MAGEVTAMPNAWLEIALALVLAPLLNGISARIKAVFAGRHGPPLLQLYFDLAKLLRKGAVYSQTTTWVFRAGPIVSLATTLTALLLLPASKAAAPIAFSVDFVLLAYVLALGRFFMVIAALDTGSSFEGMGASREVHFAALAEPTLLLGMAALARKTGALSLSQILPATSPLAPEVGLVAAALAIVLLCENARIPFDDPATHLELTMVHEVMVLDHSGPDLAFIQYAAALKLWLWSALLTGLLLPLATDAWPAGLATTLGVFALACGIGVVESSLARLRLLHVPRLLATAVALATVALILVVR
jgi:formate hydrogenlyase subunit 4